MKKIYTRSGDQGETSVRRGRRLRKDDSLLEAMGVMDELNCVIGAVHSSCDIGEIREVLIFLQRDLSFDLSVLDDSPSDMDHFTQKAEDIEVLIDRFVKDLPELNSFILPVGEQTAARLHVARAVCRRLERRIVGCGLRSPLPWINRLSDLLFVLGRYVNFKKGFQDEIV